MYDLKLSFGWSLNCPLPRPYSVYSKAAPNDRSLVAIRLPPQFSCRFDLSVYAAGPLYVATVQAISRAHRTPRKPSGPLSTFSCDLPHPSHLFPSLGTCC